LIGRDGGATEDPRHVITETPLELAGQTIGFTKASAEGGFADQTFPVRADPHGGRDGGVAVFEEHRLDAAVACDRGSREGGSEVDSKLVWQRLPLSPRCDRRS
jgi:hypothetical protein